MLKLTGAALILLAPLFCAAAVYLRQRRTDRTLAAFLELLSFSAGEISSELLTLPELARRLEEEGAAELRPFWQKLRAELVQKRRPFEEIWHSALRGECLSPAAVQILEKYPGAVRSYDTEQIRRDLRQLQQALEEERSALRRSFRRDFKIRTGLQLSAAFLLMILLF